MRSRMAARGLVTRRRCPSDQRGAFVVVTAEGRGAIEAAAPGHVAAVRRYVIDRLTPDQVDALAAITQAVLSALAERPSAPADQPDPGRSLPDPAPDRPIREAS